MGMAGKILIIVALAVVFARAGATAREATHSDRPAAFRLSHEIRPLPRPPIIVNSKPPRPEKTASDVAARQKQSGCRSCGASKRDAQRKLQALRSDDGKKQVIEPAKIF